MLHFVISYLYKESSWARERFSLAYVVVGVLNQTSKSQTPDWSNNVVTWDLKNVEGSLNKSKIPYDFWCPDRYSLLPTNKTWCVLKIAIFNGKLLLYKYRLFRVTSFTCLTHISLCISPHHFSYSLLIEHLVTKARM